MQRPFAYLTSPLPCWSLYSSAPPPPNTPRMQA
uniref:Uncharacterized protein n=1 Tax=Arundo donax TaxID=35708 RepID=A0A0A9H0B1_ARUDO